MLETIGSEKRSSLRDFLEDGTKARFSYFRFLFAVFPLALLLAPKPGDIRRLSATISISLKSVGLTFDRMLSETLIYDLASLLRFIIFLSSPRTGDLDAYASTFNYSVCFYRLAYFCLRILIYSRVYKSSGVASARIL